MSSPTYDVKTDFYIVMIIPITFNIIDFLGSVYIFYRTYLRWKFDYYKISLSFRFPFYIAITDFIFSSITLTNFLYSASRESIFLKGGAIMWPSPICEILGFLGTASVLLNIFLVGAISITTWLRVVQEYYIRFGKYDYKIWVPVVFMSLLIPLITVNSYGANKYWCGGKNSSLLTILMLITINFTLSTIIFCYVHVLKTVHNVKEELSAENSYSTSIHHTDIERRSLRKVLTYILVFIIQYIPIVMFNILTRTLKIQHVILFALSPSAISIGGIGNLIQYIYNEGLKVPYNNSSSNNRLQESESGGSSINISVTDNNTE